MAAARHESEIVEQSLDLLGIMPMESGELHTLVSDIGNGPKYSWKVILAFWVDIRAKRV